MGFYNKIDGVFDWLFSQKMRSSFERLILAFASIGFVIHLGLIFLKRYQIDFPFNDTELLADPISAIYTPFSFILLYEAYLLVYYLPRSFTTSISKQYEIIALVVIRKIFKDIPHIEMSQDWYKSEFNLQILVDLSGILILFFLIYVFKKTREKLPIKTVSPKINRFISSKKLISILLIPTLIIIASISLTDWLTSVLSIHPPSQSSMADVNQLFFNNFFTLLIFTDVFILLLSFQYTLRNSQLIRNTGFIISTVLLRLSFGAEGIFNILLIITGVVFGLLILKIYNAIETDNKELST